MGSVVRIVLAWDDLDVQHPMRVELDEIADPAGIGSRYGALATASPPRTVET